MTCFNMVFERFRTCVNFHMHYWYGWYEYFSCCN